MNQEKKLLRSAMDGNTTAFEQIVKKYQSLICAITFSGTGRVDVSEELAQETFLSAWKNLRQLTDLSGFQSWLCTIARNMVHGYYRKKKPSSIDPADFAQFSDHTIEPSDQLINQEEQAMLEKALMQIPPEYREPFVMYYRQGKSTREVAVGLGLNESTTRTRLHRARQLLREEIAVRLERTLEKTAPGKAFTKTVMVAVGGAVVGGLSTGANAASIASNAAGTGASTGIGAVMSTVTAKIVTAAAVIALGVGSVMVYQSVNEQDAPQPLAAQTTVDTEKEAVSNQTTAAASIEDAEDDPVNNQLSANIDNEQTGKLAVQQDTIEQADTNNTALFISKHDKSEEMPVDKDNQDENILSLKLVSKETDQAIPDAYVKFRLYGDREIKAEGATNQFGRFDFQHDKAKFTSLTITVAYEGYVPTKISFRDKAESLELPLNYTFTMEKGTSIGGIITNEENQPVEGVAVSLLVPSDEQAVQPSIRPDIWDYVVKTDAEGKWRCDIMPSKLDDVWISLAHPDYVDDNMYGTTEKPSMEALRALTGIMVMKKGLEVSGIVMDTKGNTISNAFVAQGSDRWGSHYPDTRTDEEGRFHFVNAQPGEMILTVSAEGKAPDLKRFEVRPELEDIEFRLEPGNIIRGRVIDSDGNPIQGAFVAADTWRSHRSIHWRVDTDKDGRFQWNEAPADEVLFDLGKSKYMSIRGEPLTPLPDNEEWELVMYRPTEVSGTVVDAETGQFIESFNLVPGFKSSEEDDVWWNTRSTRTFTNGHYKKIYSEPRYGYALKVEADGYIPAISRVFSPEEEVVVIDFALEKGDGVFGFVYLPDGSPVQGAEVMLSTRGTSIENGLFVQKREQPYCETDENGRFSFTAQVEDFVIAVVHQQGFAQIHSSEFAESAELVLEPWAHIEGTVYVGREIGAGETVVTHRYYDHSNLEPRVYIYGKSTADTQGTFKFHRVVAGQLQIGREIKTSANTSSYTDNEHVEIASGETLEVRIGGKGRPVAGRFVVPAGSKKIDWKVGWTDISTKWDIETPKPIYPEGFAAMSQEEQREWLTQWRQSDELKAYREEVEALRKQRRNYPVIVNEDGAFRCDGVEAGHYQLRGNFTEPSNAEMFMGKIIGGIEVEFDVPQMPDGVSDEVLELGDFVVDVFTELEPGQKAPEIVFEDMQGRTKKLSYYSGKFVLIDVWHWQAREDAKGGLEEMGQLYQEFGSDPRFVMLSLTSKTSTPPPLMKQYIDHYGMDWEIGLFYDRRALREYGIQDYPSRFLIEPDGILLSKNLKGEELVDAIEKVLSQ